MDAREDYQHRALLRLAAAAALETHAQLPPTRAWELTRTMPAHLHERLADAAQDPAAPAHVRALLAAWSQARQRTDPRPYPLFAEPPGASPLFSEPPGASPRFPAPPE